MGRNLHLRQLLEGSQGLGGTTPGGGGHVPEAMSSGFGIRPDRCAHVARRIPRQNEREAGPVDGNGRQIVPHLLEGGDHVPIIQDEPSQILHDSETLSGSIESGIGHSL